MRNSHRWIAGLLTGISSIALATTAANAQAQSAAVPAVSDDDAETIIVTGSRVIQNGNESPTPLTVVSTQQLLQNTPSNIQDGLQSLPILSGAQNGPQRQPGNSGGNGAAHTLNLRNVGTTRTLVLFNNRRVPPTSPTGEVNVDLIPSMLLQRVDIVTGGASAVYGSDAVTGVVNFVMDRKYNGIKVDGQAGISQRGDAPEQRIGVAAGTRLFDGRGHIEGSYEFYNSPGIDNRLVRQFGRDVITMQGSGTTAVPYRLVYNTRLNSTSFYGVIKSGPLADQVFRTNGVLSPFVHGTRYTGVNGVESGGDGAYYSKASLLSLFVSHQAYGRFDYDLSDNIRFFAEGIGFWSHNRNNHQNNELPRSTTISSTNAFLSPTIQSQLAGTTTFTYSKMFDNIPVLQPDTRTSTLFGNIGFEGDLGG
jgi:outer membrane receptor protein involved in Fe transport